MGGNLFKLGRVPRTRYLDLEAEVRSVLNARIGPDAYRVPRYYGDKPDFGDMDVVVCTDRIPGNWAEVRMDLLQDLGVVRYMSRGEVFSTVFRDLQVDYFTRGEETFLSTVAFLDWNDLGNILGKMFRRMGLKYGQNGLSYVYRGPNGRGKSNLLLTRDTARILEVLGLDPGPWRAGFDSLESMFRWVVSSPYFSSTPFLNRSRSTERRVRLRTTMAAFVRFLEREDIGTGYEYLERSRYIPVLTSAFPEVGLEDWIRETDARWRRAARIRERFNGDLIRELRPELSGRRLGAFIREVRSSVPEFEDRILEMSSDAIASLIQNFDAPVDGDP